MLSKASKIPLKSLSQSQQYNLLSNQKKAQNEQIFVTLGKISEHERVEIIEKGFQLQAEGKKYYESTQEYSLSQLRGYSIKYETIRRTKLYQQLKP